MSYGATCTVYNPKGLTLADVHEAQEKVVEAEMKYWKCFPSYELSNFDKFRTAAPLCADDARCGIESTANILPPQPIQGERQNSSHNTAVI